MQATVAEIAKLVGGRVAGDPDRVITGVAALTDAGPGQLSFLRDAKYRPFLGRARAGAILIQEPTGDPLTFIVVNDPAGAFARVAEMFHPAEVATTTRIHPTAVIDPTARVAAPVSVGAHAVIGAGVVIGAGSIIHAGVVVGDRVAIGAGSVLHPNVVLYPGVSLGARVIVHSNAVIGADGFGYARVEGRYRKVPQVGRVVVEDDVEIGACTTIDRATLGETRIRRGCKIDNLVQVGHNCVIDEDTALAAQVGVSGSTRIGKRVQLGGQAGLAGHIQIADDVVIGPGSGVPVTIDEPGTSWLGVPVAKGRQWLRYTLELSRMGDLRTELKALATRVAELERQRTKDSGAG